MLKNNLINISTAIIGLTLTAISFIWILNNNFSLDSAGAALGIGLGLAIAVLPISLIKRTLVKLWEMKTYYFNIKRSLKQIMQQNG